MTAAIALVCALYASDGVVLAVYFPENSQECIEMHDAQYSEIIMPRSIFGGAPPATIAWRIQHMAIHAAPRS